MSYGVLSQVVDLTAQATFQTAPDITADFLVECWCFDVDGAAGDEVFVSFDGSTVHGYCKKGVQLQSLCLEVPHKKVWLKGTCAGTLKAVVHATAEND